MAAHPLDPLSADEVTAAAAIVRRDRDLPDQLFAQLALREPDKADVDAFDADPARAVDRRAWAVVLLGPNTIGEAVVNLTQDRVESFDEVVGERPYLLFTEIINAMAAVKAHPEWIAAMALRGLEGDDLDRIQMDPWPPGTFGLAHEEGRRLAKVIFYWREDPEDNGYAHPIEGVMVYVDVASAEVLEVVDTGVVPVPRVRRSYYPEHVGPPRTDLKPIEITQPEGPSFTVDGNLVR